MKKILFSVIAILMCKIGLANITIYGGCVASSTNGSNINIYCGDRTQDVCVIVHTDGTWGCNCPGGCPLKTVAFDSYDITPAPPGSNYSKKVTFYYHS